MKNKPDKTMIWLKLCDAVDNNRKVKISLSNFYMPEYLQSNREIGDYCVGIRTARAYKKKAVHPDIIIKPIKTTKYFVNVDKNNTSMVVPEWTKELLTLVEWEKPKKILKMNKFHIKQIEKVEVL